MSFSSKADRIPELDGLRGIAIGIVLFFHYFFLTTEARPGSLLAYLFAPGRIGWSGVDLFFVLSGFLIGGILLDAREASNFYRVFYARRFFRIIPPYLFLLLAYLALGTLVRFYPDLSLVVNNRLPISVYFPFLQNFWMGARNTLGGSTLGVTWSLAVEEQFYLTLPLLIRFVPTRRLVPVLLSGIGLAEVFRLSLLFLLPNNGTLYVALMPCRADALLLGVLGAYSLRQPTWKRWLESKRRQFWMTLLVLAGLIVVMIRLLPKLGYTLMAAGGYTVIAVFFLIFLLQVLLQDSWLSQCLRWSWLRGLGMIAYGTYLFHELSLNAYFAVFRSSAPRIVSPRDLIPTFAALASTLVFCWLSWKFIEKPLVRLGHRWNYSGETGQNRFLAAGQAGPEPAECRRYQDSVAQ